MASATTELGDLQQARANAAAILRKLTEDALGNPSAKPTYSLDGKSVSWETYQAFWWKQWKEINQAIQITANRGGFEVRSRAVTY